MTNPTSNYNFQMPTATDLVTDLPADFEVFGQAVDTRLKALQPGTTLGDLAYSSATANTNTRLGIGSNGQVLGVVGGVPAWTTDASGMTNPMTTTGDTIYSSSGSTPARLAIGSTGNVLTVAGGVPTWAAPSAGGANWSLLNSGGTNLTAASSITVSGISGADGILIGISSASGVASGFTMSFRFNGDTGANYNSFDVNNTGLNAYSAGIFYSQPYLSSTDIIAANSGNNVAASITGYIYLSGCNSSGNKAFWGVAGGDSVSSSINHDQHFFGGVYTGSSAITSVTVKTGGTNFDAGKIWVYTTA
jgi:hypothetical protein